MAEDLRRLKSIRGAYKGHCTRNIGAAETIMQCDEPSNEELQTILERVVTRMDAITVVDQKIETKVEENDLEA